MLQERRSARRSRIDPVWFINNLTHAKGEAAGEPFRLRGWQKRIVQQVFKRRKDGFRQYRTALLMLPRKNGKSELAAAIALYGLLADGEVGAEVYSAAADKDQAGLVFGVAAQMVRNDPELERQVEIIDSQKRIVHRKSGSFYRAISAEAYSKHGFNASMVIYDELHAAPSRELYDVLSTSMGARKQPLFLVISTAGYDRHSILWELYAHAKKVLEQPTLDPTFLPILYEAPIDADWTDRDVWKAANPALGDFRSLEDLEILAARAREIPAQENTFRRLYLNQWTEQAERWISLPTWDACLAPARPPARRRLYVGMDLSSTKDLTALVGVSPDDDGFEVVAKCFVPEESLRDRSLRDRVPYEQWRRDGLLFATPGPTIDYEAVRRELLIWSREYDLKMVAYDRWNAMDLVTRLEKQDGILCVPIGQGFAGISAPTKSLEQAILSKRLRHDGHPVLRWCVGNVAVEQDSAGNLKPSKAVSTERIDAVVALIMAVDVMDRNAAGQPHYSVMVVG
jgi:phage terminase large subunit-like protein